MEVSIFCSKCQHTVHLSDVLWVAIIRKYLGLQMNITSRDTIEGLVLASNKCHSAISFVPMLLNLDLGFEVVTFLLVESGHKTIHEPDIHSSHHGQTCLLIYSEGHTKLITGFYFQGNHQDYAW